MDRKTSVTRRVYKTHSVIFRPLGYSDGSDYEPLRNLLEAQEVTSFPLRLLRRRGGWATTLPVGAFLSDFRPGVVTPEADLAAREELFAAMRKNSSRQLFNKSEHIIEKDGSIFYYQIVIDMCRKFPKPNAFFQALHTYLNAAARDPSLVCPPKTRPFVPFEQRVDAFGNRVYTRGPQWTPAEDFVLRQWFGQRTTGSFAGQHAKLTDTEWERVLEQLGGRRTRKSVLARITVLNKAIAARFLFNGYVPRDRVREYMSAILGERPIRPKLGPALPSNVKRVLAAEAGQRPLWGIDDDHGN